MLKRLLATLALLALATTLAAQVTVPFTLTAGTTIKAGDLNSNFSTLGSHALDRLSGGNISGNITADSGITIDGIDLSVALCSTCAATFKDLTLASPVTGLTVGGNVIVNSTGKIPALTATYFTALDASTLTGLNATQLTAGTVPDARFPATLPAASGVNLTSLNASNLASGTTATARLGSGSADSTKYLRGDSTWQNAPCLPTPVAKSAIYTAALCDMVEATGTFTVTLPAASTATAGAKSIIDVKNMSTGVITIARAGSDTIDGATSYSLTLQYQNVTLIANAAGTGWDIR